MVSISPFLRSPFTDITGGMISHQLLGRCQKEEMVYMDCLEAYGLTRGMKKCVRFYHDYRECHTLEKQFKRVLAMQDERQRQIDSGKLKKEGECDWRYVTPKIDSY